MTRSAVYGVSGVTETQQRVLLRTVDLRILMWPV
jgi:hypothetical protein